MSNEYNVWDLHSLAELTDQLIYLNIVLVGIISKCSKLAFLRGTETYNLLENRRGTGATYGYDVDLKIDVFFFQCLLELPDKLLECALIIITICDEVDVR